MYAKLHAKLQAKLRQKCMHKNIDKTRQFMYNNETVKVSLFKKGRKKYYGNKEKVTYVCRIKSAGGGA